MKLSSGVGKIRFGLCCLFAAEPIKFRTARYVHLSRLDVAQRLARLGEIILWNLFALDEALRFCHGHDIRDFRISSDIMPLCTHPDVGYDIEDLPAGGKILRQLFDLKDFAGAHGIRLTFHPDQFVVLNSPRSEVVRNAVRDLLYHARLADLLGADLINIHLGGVYGDKKQAMGRFRRNYAELPAHVKAKLAVENDDKSYTPADLVPLCGELGIPLVYDVHHHRCKPDGLSVEEASALAYATWNREPLFHISSPRNGWDAVRPERHAEGIRLEDFPMFWKEMLPLTVEVEAKGKELAVLELMGRLYPAGYG